MAILDLKSDLSKFRKPTPVTPLEEKPLPFKPKKIASDSKLLIPNNKIPLFDNPAINKEKQAKTVTYKVYKIGNRIGNRKYSSPYNLSKLINTRPFNEIVLPKISKGFNTIVDKVSKYIKTIPKQLNKVSLFKLQLPKPILVTTNFVKILPKNIVFVTPYKKILPKLIQHPTNFIKVPTVIKPKISLYVEQIPSIIDKISLYIEQTPKKIRPRSLFTLTLPKELAKISLYNGNPFNNVSGYDTQDKIIAQIKNARLYFFYVRPLGRIPVVNYFNDLQSGARGFTAFMKTSQYIGLTDNSYEYPKTVNNGRLVDLRSFLSFYQDRSFVTFRNNLARAKYIRIYNTPKNPYVDKAGKLTNKEYSLEIWSKTKRSPSPLELIYTSYNLKDNSTQGISLFGLEQPFILRGIQRKDSPYPQLWGNGFDDGFIRGGAVTSTERAFVDVQRIGSFLRSGKGLVFLLKQAGLQRTNPNSEIKLSSRVYNPASTILSLATQHLGIRFRRDGIGIQLTYSDVHKTLTTQTNRLVLLKTSVYRNPLVPVGAPIPILTGVSGPNSVYGFGVTTINRWVNSLKLTTSTKDGVKYNLVTTTSTKDGVTYNLVTDPGGGSSTKWYSISSPFNQTISRLRNRSPISKNFTNGKVTYNGNNIYSKIFNDNGLKSKIDPESYDSNKINLSQNTEPTKQYYTSRYSLVQQRATNNTTNIINFLVGAPKDFLYIPDEMRKEYKPIYGIQDFKPGRDLTDIRKSQSVDLVNVTKVLSVAESKQIKDIIKFRFDKHDNSRESLVFRPFIVTFSENYSAENKQIHIIGRADHAYLYSSFERTCNIVFKVAVLSRQELTPIWQKLNKLVNFCMPEYSESLDYRMKGPLVNFTYGDLYNETPCFISSVSYDIDEDTTWEIDEGVQVPKVLSVGLSMTILNSRRPTNSSWNYSTNLLREVNK